MNAGRLRKKIEIWRYTPVDDSLGGKVNKLQLFHAVYGEIIPMRGNSYLEYYKESHELIYKITMRFFEKLSPADILVYHGRQFAINSIINIGEMNYMQEIMCTEKLEKTRPEIKNA